jgi:mRNA-degrading endonuclease RelE of RelBE toxin-antitoxin system
MDKISKFLKRLSHQERFKLKEIINNILAGDIQDFDVKKLKGHSNLFRVRAGDIRIVFRNQNSLITLLFVGRRSDIKYKKFK